MIALDLKRRLRHLQQPFPILGVLALGLISHSSLAVAQAPEPGAAKVASFVPAIEEEWNRLRAQVGTQEVTAPREAIASYQRFDEQRGAGSELTSLKVKSVIAQLYWQGLGDRVKALEIYDRTLQKYGSLPQGELLQRERDFVAAQGSFRYRGTLAPVTLQTQNSTAITRPTLAPVRIARSQTVQDVVAPKAITLSLPADISTTLELPLVVIAPAFSVDSQAALVPVNARMAVLMGFLAQWRTGRMSWEQLVAETKLSPEDVSLLSATPHLVSFYSEGAAIRGKLGDTIKNFPEMVRNWSTLPVPAQVALAEAYTREKNPLAEGIYQELLKQDVPANAWWNKELLLVRLAKHYSAIGNFAKAAETSLQIVGMTSDEAWGGNALVDAARYYKQAGETAKAQELYQRAQKSSYGWAKGLSIYDQALHLIQDEKHEEARRLLNTPLEGRYSEQVKVALLSLLARSYYATGEMDKAKNYATQITAQAKSVQLLVNEGLEFQVSSAKSVLEWSERWEKAPLVVEPKEIRLVAGGEASFMLSVRTRVLVPLTIRSDAENITTGVIPQATTKSTYFTQQEIWVQVAQNQMNPGFKANITITSEKLPGVVIQVPLFVDKAKEEAAKDKTMPDVTKAEVKADQATAGEIKSAPTAGQETPTKAKSDAGP